MYFLSTLFVFYLFLSLFILREREKIPSRLRVVTVQSPMQGLNSHNFEIMTGAKIKGQMLKQLSHPGVFTCILYLFTYPISPDLGILPQILLLRLPPIVRLILPLSYKNTWVGAPGWLSWLSTWLQLRPWSHSLWVQALWTHVLCADSSASGSSDPGACFGFCVSLSLSAPPPLILCLSVKNE